MNDRQEITRKVCSYLGKLADQDKHIVPETNIAEELSLDSVNVLDLIMELEDDFDISIPMNLTLEVQTVTDLVDIIEKAISDS